jgi:phage terminase small subunit
LLGDKNNKWGLTELERLFAIEYFTTKNATQSYLKTYGGKYSTANGKGHKLREKKEVKAFLNHLFETVKNDKILTAEEVLIGLSNLARGNDTDLAKHQKIYAKDKTKALELLAKHYALLTEVSKQEIEQKVTIVDDMGSVENEN